MAGPLNNPRRQLTNLSEPIQIRELNRQLDWICQQLLGGLSMKNISNNGKQEAIDLIESTTADIYDPQIEDIQDAISAIEGDLSDVQGDIIQLGSELTYAQDDIDDLQSDVTDLDGALSSVSNRVTKLETSLVYPIEEP